MYIYSISTPLQIYFLRYIYSETPICDVACQNQAFVAEMSCSVMIFLGKNVTLAFV